MTKEATLTPGGDVEDFHVALNGRLQALGFLPSSQFQALHEVAIRFLKNRQLDVSPTDLSIVRDLKDACDRPASRLGVRMRILGDEVIDAICGDFPGHSRILETLDVAPQAIHLPDHNAFFGEAAKNLWRRETTADARGMIVSRQPPHIAECIPLEMTLETQIKTLFTLVDLIVLTSTTNEMRNEYLWGFGSILLEIGNLDDPAFASSGAVALADAIRDDRLPDHLKTIIPAIVEMHHGRHGDAEEMSLRRFCFGTVAALMERIDRTGKRRALETLADLFPEEFRSYLSETANRLCSQYQIEGDGRGKQKSTHRWMNAHASWCLIIDVMDALWPAANGPLDKLSNALILGVSDAILNYADPKIGFSAENGDKNGRLRRANYTISTDDLSKIGSLRSNIYVLDEMLSVMNLRLSEMEREKFLEGSLASDEERDLRRRVEALQSWRREAQRRLRQGDWEKGRSAKQKKRATGPRVPIPAFSLKLKNLPINERIIAASTAAFQAGL